jgi:hypothetical protein
VASAGSWEEFRRESNLKSQCKLPVDKLRGVSLDSYAAARRVAEWLQDSEAIKALDRLVQWNDVTDG